jgi:hypothetical protein
VRDLTGMKRMAKVRIKRKPKAAISREGLIRRILPPFRHIPRAERSPAERIPPHNQIGPNRTPPASRAWRRVKGKIAILNPGESNRIVVHSVLSSPGRSHIRMDKPGKTKRRIAQIIVGRLSTNPRTKLMMI